MALKAKLYIETATRNERTFLKSSFCTPPFKLADVTEDRSSKDLKLMIRSSSPGVLDGDEYEIKISIAENSSLQVTTQSYQRLFHMKGSATQTMDVEMKNGSSFTYLPHPCVPHQGSSYFSKNKIHIANGCRLLWGEVISCGRKLNGEIFCFTSFHSLTQIFKNGKLVVKENLLLQPLQSSLTGIGQMEGFSHQATLLFIDETCVVNSLVEMLRESLKLPDNIAFGVTALPVNGVLVRLLGGGAEQLFALLNAIHLLLKNSMPTVSLQPQVYVA